MACNVVFCRIECGVEGILRQTILHMCEFHNCAVCTYNEVATDRNRGLTYYLYFTS